MIVNPLTHQRLGLFPVTTSIRATSSKPVLAIAGCSLVELAQQHGTPLYLYDQATLNASLEAYQQALDKFYPGSSGITYAGKAFLCLAMAQWVKRQGLRLDCSSEGEVFIATSAGLNKESILVHGVSKSAQNLAEAVRQAGTIVVDSLSELQLLREVYLAVPPSADQPAIWLRLRPGVVAGAHPHLQTAHADSKFGLSLKEASQALVYASDNDLSITGAHFHLGSNFRDAALLEPAIEIVLSWIASTGWAPQVFSPGGGWGIPYHEDDLPFPSIEKYVSCVAQMLVAGCQKHSLPLPQLQLEPGRSLVGRAGVALYRVNRIKRAAERRWLLLDGGMADNPRPALYAARYTALPLRDPERPAVGLACLGGAYCESGDVLIHDLLLPELDPGEWIAVPASGAYQLSMGSNYNGARRPAVLWLDDIGAHLIQHRETLHDLLRRDQPLPRS
jgi:diaminopimelate decarboxylase